MPKTRVPIPRATSDKVLKEYNHRCAVCGVDRPQLHHIDENPSNNDPMNLIPLCPNCHLIDQHDPTRSIEITKLQLFRVFKDPTILKPQFHALFNRFKFLDTLDDVPDDKLEDHVKELTDFTASLKMGSFYSKQIQQIMEAPSYGYAVNPFDSASVARMKSAIATANKEHRNQLRAVRDQVINLVIELLRFQEW